MKQLNLKKTEDSEKFTEIISKSKNMIQELIEQQEESVEGLTLT